MSILDGKMLDELDGHTRARDLAESDSVDLPEGVTSAVYVKTDGNLVVILEDDTTAVTFPVTAGQYLRLKVRRFMAASTATVIGLY